VSSNPALAREIVARLDPDKAEHWTSQGVPRMDAMAALGLNITRQQLNELVPGLTRETVVQARASQEQPPAPAQPKPSESGLGADMAQHLANCGRHLLERAQRRQAAIACLAAGGFTLADLEPVTSPLQRRMSAQNRQARRELAG
jgi:hypothetical protein